MRCWGYVAAVVSLALAVPAGATTIVRVTDEGLVDQAPLVVVARVAERGPADSGAATEYRVEVERVLKGAVGPELVLRVVGGVGAEGLGRRVYGAPSFDAGDRAVLFLEPRPDGEYRLLHLMQGAFREVHREGRTLAVRDLSEVAELRRQDGEIVAGPAAATEPVRDFAAFVDWIDGRVRGQQPAADYRVELPARVSGESRVAAPFVLFTDPQDGTLLRWFEFDTNNGSVAWRFGTGGQAGVPGGGQAQFQTALQAWNADPQTPIRYTFAGTSGATGGLEIFDDLNVILFNDPNDELTDLMANCSGTLALGGGGYFATPQSFRNTTYYAFVEGDIVVNNGLECFFGGSPNAAEAAEELFAHELGHTLGIGHSEVANALMSAFIHDDGRGAQLHPDDLAAARALYRQDTNPPNPPAAPSNLTAEALSSTEVVLAWQDNSNNENEFVIEGAELGGNFVELGTVLANNVTAEVFGLEPATGFVFRVRARNQNGTSAATNEVQVATNALPGPCIPGAQTLCLTGGRFRVEVDWATSQGTSGQGQVVPGVSSADSGLFWFFDANNWEMLIKALNACPVNDHFWVFAAATTNVEYVITVTDTETTAVKTYFNPLNTTAQTVTDTGAFATCP